MSRREKKTNITKGLLSGIVAGLAASWVMNQFQEGVQKVETAWEKSAHSPESQTSQPKAESDDATMKTADRLYSRATHRHLTHQQKAKAGPAIHYAYGAVLGGIYGALAEVTPLATLGFGAGFATAAWLFGDEIAVWRFGLSGPPTHYPVSSHARALASHLVYGTSAELVRKTVRAVA